MVFTVLVVLLGCSPLEARDPDMLRPEDLERFARLALDCIHREYPNKVSHVLNRDADAKPPRELTPVFFGCFDWHSAVHGHWLLVRLCRKHYPPRVVKDLAK